MTHAHSVPLKTIWPSICAEAKFVRTKEPTLSAFIQNNVLTAEGILPSLGRILSTKLASHEVSAASLLGVFMTVYQASPRLEESAQYDLISTMQNDPAAHDFITPFLFFKGYHALQAYRLSHWFWHQGRQHFALHLQNRISEQFGVDIHPAVAMGSGIMLDHATGIVIGETAVVEDNVLFWHGVTLGSKILTSGDRHPKIRQGVHLGAGSTVLGPVEIGANARVAAGSVVVDNVEPGAIVAGIPAKVIGAH